MFRILVLSVVFAGLAACSSDSGSSKKKNKLTEIEDVNSAAATAVAAQNSSIQAVTLSSSILSNALTDANVAAPSYRAPQVQEPITLDCSKSNTYTLTETLDDTDVNYFSLLTQYDNCENYDGSGYERINGSSEYTILPQDGGARYTLTSRTGNGNTSIESSDLITEQYDSTPSLLQRQQESLSTTIEYDETANLVFGDFSLSLNGAEQLHDAVLNTTDTTYYRSMDIDISHTEDATTETAMTSLNGVLETVQKDAQAQEYSTVSTFEALVISETYDHGSDQTSMLLSGKMSYNTTDGGCDNGSFSYETQDAIIKDSSGQIIAGVLVINDEVTVTYNADGGLSVTVAGSTQSFTQQELSGDLCL